jgi:hypothetical protein
MTRTLGSNAAPVEGDRAGTGEVLSRLRDDQPGAGSVPCRPPGFLLLTRPGVHRLQNQTHLCVVEKSVLVIKRRESSKRWLP